MLIKACLHCKSHKVKPEEEEEMSYCEKEYCWSQYSKCVARKALDRFLNEECIRDSALDYRRLVHF